MNTAHKTEARQGLMLHCGGVEVPYSAVRDLPDPAPLGPKHFPMRHDRFVDTVVDALHEHDYEVTDQCHALWGDGLRYFGIILLQGNGLPSKNSGSEWQFALGLRNSWDESFAMTCLGGSFMPWICDNLCWSGGEIIKIVRKNTRFAERDLEGLTHEKIGNVVRVATDIEARFDAYKSFDFATALPSAAASDAVDVRDNCRRACASRFILDAASARAVAPTRVVKVWDEFNREDGPGGHAELAGGTAYTMLNAFTEVEKASPSLLEGPRRNSRLISLLDAQVGLQSTLVSVDE